MESSPFRLRRWGLRIIDGPINTAIMKIKFLLPCVFLILSSFEAGAQLTYHNPDHLPLYGKISRSTQTRYERLPSGLEGTVRPAVWNLGKNTAGLYLRFRSNSPTISLRWTLLNTGFMNHMAPSGSAGFDLYCMRGDGWEFVGVARPNLSGKECEATIIADMDTTAKEFMLFFPLYNGVQDLQIGVDSGAMLLAPAVNLPHSDKPVVCYGTSILQGGCATRPGMVFTNILTREFNRSFINLGFSANAQLDYEIADLIGEQESALIILDFMANVNASIIEAKLDTFYHILRRKAPETAILLVEMPDFPQAAYDQRMRKELDQTNAALRKVYNTWVTNGDQNIHIVSSLGMIGQDNEGTVDGVHFTDLGFERYANYLQPYIRKYLTE